MVRFRISGMERRFLKDRSVFLFGDLNEEMTLNLVAELQYLGKQNKNPITIYIHSGGGDVDGMAAIIDEMILLQSKGIVIRTVVKGKAYSAAACISALGTLNERYVTANSSIMLHDAQIESGESSVTSNKKLLEYTQEQYNKILKLVAKACQRSSKAKLPQFLEEINKTLWLGAEDAIKYKLADKIWDGE